MKKSFALLTTLLLVFLISIVSIRLIENDLLSSNLNKLKYLHLQATIYIDNAAIFIKEHNNFEIDEYKTSLNDERFQLQIINDENNSSIYYVTIETTNNSHVRLSQKIIK
ncbi:MAG: hypothetical protein WBG69_08205 [Arcobacteraceae bacterium]